MFLPMETFLGIDQSTALLITAIVAAAATFGSMALVLFFTFIPYVSEEWATELGSAIDRFTDNE